MRELQKDHAIVLRLLRYQERHQIVTALTENFGLVSAIARNSVQSRRFGGCLEPFTASLWHFQLSSGMAQLKEAHFVHSLGPDHSLSDLLGDYEKYTLASAFCELLLKILKEDEPVPSIFRLLANSLWQLAAWPSQQEKLSLLIVYLGKLLQTLGLQPALQHCHRCQCLLSELPLEQAVFGLPAEAAWICLACYHTHAQSRLQPGVTVPGASLRLLHHQLTVSIRSLALAQQAALRGAVSEQLALFEFLMRLYAFHVPELTVTPVRSLDAFLAALALPPLHLGPQALRGGQELGH